MGTLTLTVAKDGAAPASYAVNIADADIDRLAAAYGAQYFPQGVEVSPATDEAEAVVRPPNTVEIVTAISTGLVTNVVSFERTEAARAAQDAVQPIAVSPV